MTSFGFSGYEVDRPPEGFYPHQPDAQTKTAVNKSASGIRAGVALKFSTSQSSDSAFPGMTPCVAAADVVRGYSVAPRCNSLRVTSFPNVPEIDNLDSFGNPVYPVNGPLNYLDSGVMYMHFEVSASPGDALFRRFAPSIATPALSLLGRIRKDADAATAVAAPELTLLEPVRAGQSARVKIHIA
jgi:hypothetical protein